MQMLFKCIIISFLSLLTVQVLNAAETGGMSIRDDDTKDIDDKGQKCLASNGKPCHFPFKVQSSKGKVHRNIFMVLKFLQCIFRCIHHAWIQPPY